jgi:hypothetical protein
MIETKDFSGNTYIIVPCTLDDIPVHFEMVKNLVPEEDRVDYVDKLKECVEKGTAFRLEDNSCFLYYSNYRDVHAYGYGIYGVNSPAKFVALLMGIFWKIDTRTYKLDFVPHREEFIPLFKSVITMVSLRRRMRDPRRPLCIRIDELKKKWRPIAEARGVSWAES